MRSPRHMPRTRAESRIDARSSADGAVAPWRPRSAGERPGVRATTRAQHFCVFTCDVRPDVASPFARHRARTYAEAVEPAIEAARPHLRRSNCAGRVRGTASSLIRDGRLRLLRARHAPRAVETETTQPRPGPHARLPRRDLVVRRNAVMKPVVDPHHPALEPTARRRSCALRPERSRRPPLADHFSSATAPATRSARIAPSSQCRCSAA